MRCVHEASLYQENCFITLTYNSENIPADFSLDKTHYQKFMKRLRKRASDRKIRYFHCGEYGEKNFRPHYHACLFGYDFADKEIIREGDNPLYTSALLSELWPYGYSTIGSVTFESAAYVARYVMKKVTGDAAEEAYLRVHPSTGELTRVQPEYTTMSRRPGIGAEWYRRYKKDCFPSDFLVMRGKKMKPPKYYENKYMEEIENAAEAEMVKQRRRKERKKREKDNTMERLSVKEKVKKAQIRSLKRPLDED